MQCPGQNTRYWSSNAIFEAKCPKCGSEVEFFKDEGSRRCRKCGFRVLNPHIDFGCAAYCQYAEQCLGSLPPELKARKKEQLQELVAVEMKRRLAPDFKKIGHTCRVARYAEEICKAEQGNPGVTVIASYLHDIGLKESGTEYAEAGFEGQRMDASAMAREILSGLDADEGLINEVCDIIRRLNSPQPQETTNFKVVCDADHIANLQEKYGNQSLDHTEIAGLIENLLMSEGGRVLARKLLTAEPRIT